MHNATGELMIKKNPTTISLGTRRQTIRRDSLAKLYKATERTLLSRFATVIVPVRYTVLESYIIYRLALICDRSTRPHYASIC